MCSRTLVTRSSQPFSNIMHNNNAPFPENDDRVECSKFSHDGFTTDDSVREFPGQDEVVLCRQRTAPCPSKIQGVRAAIGRHERFHSELSAGFEAEKKKANLDGVVLLSVGPKTKGQPRGVRPPSREPHRAIKELEESVLSCRSREAAATARISLL